MPDIVIQSKRGWQLVLLLLGQDLGSFIGSRERSAEDSPCSDSSTRAVENAARALSMKDREIVLAVLAGYTNKEIAKVVGISERAIKWHLRNVFEKFDVTNRTELVGVLGEAGMIGMIKAGV